MGVYITFYHSDSFACVMSSVTDISSSTLEDPQEESEPEKSPQEESEPEKSPQEESEPEKSSQEESDDDVFAEAVSGHLSEQNPNDEEGTTTSAKVLAAENVLQPALIQRRVNIKPNSKKENPQGTSKKGQTANKTEGPLYNAIKCLLGKQEGHLDETVTLTQAASYDKATVTPVTEDETTVASFGNEVPSIDTAQKL
jgi:hypothetical protein